MKATALLLACVVSVSVGCSQRSGVAYVEIENDQAGPAGRAEPIRIDPRVEVTKNEYRRLYGKQGSNIRQRMIIRGPVMIVPAAPDPVQAAPAQ